MEFSHLPKRIRIVLIVFMLLVFVPARSQIQNYAGKKISRISIYGLVYVSESEVRDYLPFRVNSVLKEEDVNLATQKLFSTGYFGNVRIFAKLLPDDTLEISVVVEELPRIEEITIIGEEELYEPDLKALLPFKEGDIYSVQDVKNGVSLIQNKYRKEGYFLAAVWHRVEEKNGKVKVKYYIDEGKNIPISKINIIGLKNLNPNDIVEVLEQKEEGIFEDGIFEESKFEEDKYRILAYAKSKGYVDAEIDNENSTYEVRWRNPKKPEEGRVIIITYKIDEGQVYYFGGYSLEHDKEFINKEFNPPERKNKEIIRPIYEPEVLLSMTEFQKEDTGEVLDETKFFRDRNTLQQAYSSQGYVYAQIQPVFTNFPLTEETLQKYENCLTIQPQNEEEKRCHYIARSLDFEKLRTILKKDPSREGSLLRHTHFIVRENNRAYIENIIIKGMKKTQEKVIRRELLIKEGQLFNSLLVERSREKIFNLGYFKEVNLEMRPGSDDKKMNLIITVEEQPTGTITMGGTYGTQSGFSVFTEVGENNLFGTGQKISTKLQYGPIVQSISVSWTEPWFYERCQDISGRYWYLKQKSFDEAPDFQTLILLVESFKNENLLLANSLEIAIKEELQVKDLESLRPGDISVEQLDKLKWIIRKKLQGFVIREEECYRSIPRPWSLSLFSGYNSERILTTALQIAEEFRFYEQASYDYNSFYIGAGISHPLSMYWSHYHRLSFTWSIISRPTSLVDTTIIQRSNLGWQLKSSLTNGITYSSIDNYINPTRGSVMDLSVEFVGQFLGGNDHFNRYKSVFMHYVTLGDYRFWGLFRNNKLSRWKITLESRISMTFTHETAPYNKKQNKEANPYIERTDKLYLGGYETIRGYDYLRDVQFPQPWYQFGGVNHLLLGSLELRFPIEPTAFWFVLFLDAGAGYLNLGELNEKEKEYVDSYDENYRRLFEGKSIIDIYQIDRYDVIRNTAYFYGSKKEWNDPKRYVLSQRNVAWDRFLYSTGIGLRVQIPVLPVRLYLAQKRYYKKGMLLPVPRDDKLNFVFAIGDYRF